MISVVVIAWFSDEGVRLWLVPQLKALCSWTPPQEEKEAMQTQQKVLSGKDTLVCSTVTQIFSPIFLNFDLLISSLNTVVTEFESGILEETCSIEYFCQQHLRGHSKYSIIRTLCPSV